MFYYGFDGKDHARNGVAFSTNLVCWEKWPQPILTQGDGGSYDETHAHKPYLLVHERVLNHFYCGVRADGYRTICLATSRPRKH